MKSVSLSDSTTEFSEIIPDFQTWYEKLTLEIAVLGIKKDKFLKRISIKNKQLSFHMRNSTKENNIIPKTIFEIHFDSITLQGPQTEIINRFTSIKQLIITSSITFDFPLKLPNLTILSVLHPSKITNQISFQDIITPNLTTLSVINTDITFNKVFNVQNLKKLEIHYSKIVFNTLMMNSLDLLSIGNSELSFQQLKLNHVGKIIISISLIGSILENTTFNELHFTTWNEISVQNWNSDKLEILNLRGSFLAEEISSYINRSPLLRDLFLDIKNFSDLIFTNRFKYIKEIKIYSEYLKQFETKYPLPHLETLKLPILSDDIFMESQVQQHWEIKDVKIKMNENSIFPNFLKKVKISKLEIYIDLEIQNVKMGSHITNMKLESLSISNLRIKNFPEDLMLKHVKHIEFSNCSIENITDSISKHENLEEIILSSCDLLESISSELFFLPKLYNVTINRFHFYKNREFIPRNHHLNTGGYYFKENEYGEFKKEYKIIWDP